MQPSPLQHQFTCPDASRSSEAVKADLEEARGAVMGPLSAASMESHARAYPHLVKLHMLGEAADCSALLQEGSLGLGPLERQRRLRWDERLAATHPSLTTQVCLLWPCSLQVLLQAAGAIAWAELLIVQAALAATCPSRASLGME